jgi:anti-sigma B factor antagonist
MVSTEEIGDVFLLRVEAVRLDSAVGTIVRNAVVDKIDATKKFALDISAVKLVDSGGLGSLVALLKNITNHQGKLALVGMNKSVRMMFELSRMDRQFSLLDDMPKALAFLQQG